MVRVKSKDDERLSEGRSQAEAVRSARAAFQAFLPKEYQEGFSRDWLMGLSPFDDRTYGQCLTVLDGQWIGIRRPSVAAALLKCEARPSLT